MGIRSTRKFSQAIPWNVLHPHLIFLPLLHMPETAQLQGELAAIPFLQGLTINCNKGACPRTFSWSKKSLFQFKILTRSVIQKEKKTGYQTGENMLDKRSIASGLFGSSFYTGNMIFLLLVSGLQKACWEHAGFGMSFERYELYWQPMTNFSSVFLLCIIECNVTV